MYNHEDNIKLVKRIDESLEYIKPYPIASTLVFQVKKNNDFYILKTALPNASWEQNHLRHENEILTDAKDIPKITHKVAEYELNDGTYSILKEYFSGDSLSSILVLDDFWKEQNVQKRKNLRDVLLDDTVRNLHSLGYAHLELDCGNIAVDKERNDVCIIDLGKALYKDSFKDERSFRDRASYDISELFETFR